MYLKPYGKELIFDLHNCDPATFSRESIKTFFEKLCDKIDMEACELYWWDDEDTPIEDRETESHLKGTSAVQFIRTSNITIHTLDLLGNVYLNIFSCKDFDARAALEFSENWFKGDVVNSEVMTRV